MFARLLPSLIAASVATTLVAQGLPNRLDSFNVDFNINTVPPNSYGGAPDLRGPWNNVPPTAFNQALLRRYTLAPNLGIDNSTITVTGGTGGTVPPVPGVPAPHTQLFSDYVQPIVGQVLTVNITNLEAGDYVLTTYHWRPTMRALAGVFETDSAGGIFEFEYPIDVTCPATFPGPNAQGLSMQSNRITIDQSGHGVLISFESGFINGLQLIPVYAVDPNLPPVCPQPQNNSLMQDPSIYVTGGNALNPVVVVGGLPGILPPPNGAGILCWVSNATNSAVNYTCPAFTNFIGVRCVGPTLYRAGDPNSPNGVGSPQPWGAYAIEINLTQAALAGIPTAPGSPMAFQLVYRDLDWAMTCATASTAIARWTVAHRITL